MSNSFAALGAPAELTDCLARLGIAEPYPIQAATLADALSGHDVLAQSPTGSGKTLAFAIPLVAALGKGHRNRPRALVLAPTRELAAQITAEIAPLADAVGARVAAFYGGTGFGEQLGALRRGLDIVVGCPGRLLDLLDRRSLDLRDVEIVVIDEVDRMADMGFLPPVRRLLAAAPAVRQTMFFSATLSRDVEKLVQHHQKAPKRHVVAPVVEDAGGRAYEIVRAKAEDRAALTARAVAGYDSAIVFCRTKHGVDRLARALERSGLSTAALHGGRTQGQRDRALADFRDGRAQVLVGTDVAARGLHVEGIDVVVHFDPPQDEDTFVHRSGRTGRAGAFGTVLSIVTSDQELSARRVHKRLGLDYAVLDDVASPEGRGRAVPAPRAVSPVHGAPAQGAGGARGAIAGRPAGDRRNSQRRRRPGRTFTARAGATSSGAAGPRRSGRPPQRARGQS